MSPQPWQPDQRTAALVDRLHRAMAAGESLADEAIDWNRAGPKAAELRQLLDDTVAILLGAPLLHAEMADAGATASMAAIKLDCPTKETPDGDR